MCGGGGGFGVCGGGGGLGPPPPSPVDKAKALFQYTFNCSLCLLYENSNMTARLSPKTCMSAGNFHEALGTKN